MKLSYQSGKYIATASYEERMIPKAAGCRWNPDLKKWWTDRPEVVLKLKEYWDDSVSEEMELVEKKISDSAKVDASIEIPAPEGLEYLPYQKAGIAYASKTDALIADEMGLGKTIQAIGVINLNPEIKRVLVICPASLRLNWRNEMQKWLTRYFSIGIVEGNKPIPLASDIIIINYDVIKSHRPAIDKIEWDLLVADEAHYLKNGKAQRTRAVVGKWAKDESKRVEPIKAKRRLLLTGTPILNRPVELWTLVHYLNPAKYSNFFYYAKRYCGAHQGRWGWDFSGSSNLDELQDGLRSSCMVRRLKKDVLTDLPPKRRQIISLPANGASGVVNAEIQKSLEWEGKLSDLQARLELAEAEDGDTSSILEGIKNAGTEAFAAMAHARYDTAIAKIPYAVDHISEAVDSSGQVVVFGHHHDVIDGLLSGLREKGITCVSLTGRDKQEARQQAVEDFQAGKAQVFVGGIAAAGVGLTLTASSHVIFVELPWTPGELSQAEDRCHRIGQQDNVLVQHIVLEGSIDQRMAQALVEKQNVIDQAMDVMVRKTLTVPIMPVREKRPSTRKAEIERIAEIISDEQIEAAHDRMKILDAWNKDNASIKNDIGFSAIDTKIGRELANKPFLSKKQAALCVILAWKYHRQVETGIFEPLKKEKK